WLHRCPKAVRPFPASSRQSRPLGPPERKDPLWVECGGWGRTAAIGCQVRHTLGVLASGGEPHPPDFIKHPSKRRLRRHAHGSIRIQDSQPRNSLYISISC